MTIFLLALLMLFPQAQRQPDPFPIPKMQVTWPSSGLSANNYALLKKAVEPRLAGDAQCEDTEPKFEYATVSLGKLGKGVIVRTIAPCNCWRGNCAISVYIRQGSVYREVPFANDDVPSGWAFGVVESRSAVPDLAIGSNAGGFCQGLHLYRYSGGKFVIRDSEAIKPKGDEYGPKNWWDPRYVKAVPACFP